MADNSISILIEAKDNASGELQKVSQSINSVGKESEDTTAKTGGLSGSLGTMRSAVSTLGAAFAGYQIVNTIENIGAAAFSSAGQLEQTNMSFQTLIGNTAQANALFGQLVQYANVTPFQAKDVTDAAKQLLAFGQTAEQTTTTVKQLGDVTAAGGGDLQAMALVTGQAFAQGKLRAQDMYQVIDDGGAGLIKIMANNVGGMQNLTAEFDKGGIPASQYFAAIQQATSQGGFAFQGALRQAQTLNGELSTLRDSATQFGMKLLGVHTDPQLGLVIDKGGLFDRAKGYINDATNALTDLGKNKTAIEAIAGAIGGLLLGAVVAVAVAIGWIPLAIVAAAAVIGGIVTVLISHWQRWHDEIMLGSVILFGLLAVVVIVVAEIIAHWASVTAFFKQAWSDAVSFVVSLMNSVRVAYYTVLNGITIDTLVFKADVNNVWTDIYVFFANTMARLYAVAFNTWQDIKAAFHAAWDEIVEFFTPIVQALEIPVRAWLAVVTYILDVIRGLWLVTWWAIYTDVIKPVFAAITLAMQAVSDFVVHVWQTVRSAAVGAWQFIYNNVVTPIAMAIMTIAGAIAFAFVTAWNAVSSAAVAAWAAISSAGAAAWNWLWTNAISPVFNAIAAAAGWVGSTVTTAFSAAANVVRQVWTDISSFFDSMWNKLTGAGAQASNSVKGAFSSVAGAIKDAFKDAIDWVIDRLNSMIHAVNGSVGKLPGVPKIADIPHFSLGTNYAPGGVAMVGENGPEAVVLPRGSQVLPAGQTRQMARSGGMGGGVTLNQTNHVYNNVDITAALREQGWRLAHA